MECRVNPRACDHLDVLSHEGVLSDLLHMAAGQESTLQDQVVSDIDAIVSRMSLEEIHEKELEQSRPSAVSSNSA